MPDIDKVRLGVAEQKIADIRDDTDDLARWREGAAERLTKAEGFIGDYREFKKNIEAEVDAIEKRTAAVENDRKNITNLIWFAMKILLGFVIFTGWIVPLIIAWFHHG